MRDREMIRFERQHADLAEQVGKWAGEHPGGGLEDAVRDLGLWPNPKDRDAQWFVWRHLPDDAQTQIRALAALEQAWAAWGYRSFSADGSTWSAIWSNGNVLAGGSPDELDRNIGAHWQAMQLWAA